MQEQVLKTRMQHEYHCKKKTKTVSHTKLQAHSLLQVKTVSRKASHSHVGDATQEGAVADQVGCSHSNSVQHDSGRALASSSQRRDSLGFHVLMV